jgi:hypothetical protein
MFQRTNTIVFCIYSLFASSAIARHVHLKHRHAPRAATTSSAIVVNSEPQDILTSTLAAPSPSSTSADAVINDIHEIQSGLNDLPEDLLAIISDLEHRLAEIEKFLAGYLDNGTALPTSTSFPAGPIGPVLSSAPEPVSTSPTAPEETSSELIGTITVTIHSDPPATTSPPTTTTIAEPESTSYTKTRSTRITRTVTRVTTVPAQRPTGITVSNNGTVLAVNGTGSFVAPAPWTTKPYLASGFSEIVTLASTVGADVTATPAN